MRSPTAVPDIQSHFMNAFLLLRKQIFALFKSNTRSLSASFNRQSLFQPLFGRSGKKHITLGELMDEYVQVYGLNHWGDSFLSCSRHRIEHYIKPYLGNVTVKDLTTHDLDLFYDSLQDRPAVILKGHKKTDATVSLSVIEKAHALLRSTLNQAVIWEYTSPSTPRSV